MAMRDFDFVEPASIGEVCALLAEDPEGSAVFAGGTDILVDLKAGLKHHRRLVSLSRIEELQAPAERSRGKEIRIGRDRVPLMVQIRAVILRLPAIRVC